MNAELRKSIRTTAADLGIDPLDLATVMSYETAGTFDPWQKGPTTKHGQHRGLIQWGEPQRKKYGVTKDTPVADQVKAAGQYLRDAGVKSGMGLLDIYSAINAGRVGRYNASDEAAGGAPGTVRDKVETQMSGHRKKAEVLMASERKKVTDPAVLAKLNRKKVTDPSILAKLNGGDKPSVDPTTGQPAGVPEFKPVGVDADASEPTSVSERMGVADKTDRLPQETSVFGDILRSAGSGIRQGVEGIVGAAGSVNEATGNAVEWAANSLGAPEPVSNAIGQVARRINLMPTAPTTEQVQSVTNSMAGAPYEPQTTAGEYARTIGEFAPNAMIGPGGAWRKAAMTVVPAVLSETAGQLTEGTEAEPYARLAGGLAGGALAAGRQPSQVKMAAKAAPTSAELKTQTDALYGAMRQAGIKYDADAFASTVQTMTDDLLKQGLRPSVAKDAFGLVDDLAKEIGKSPDFDDINGLVQMIGQKARDAAASGDGTGAKAFNVVRDHLMRFEEGAALVSRVPIPADQLNRVRGAARDTAKRNIKARILDEILVDADAYRGGFDAGVRNQIGNLMRSKRGKQLFKGEERKALLDVANGRKTVQQLSKFGLDLRSFSGNATLIPTLGAIGVGAAGGAGAGLALTAAGTVAKELAPRMTTKAFERASAAIRSGKLQDKTVMNAAKAERLKANVRRLLSAGSSMSAAQ